MGAMEEAAAAMAGASDAMNEASACIADAIEHLAPGAQFVHQAGSLYDDQHSVVMTQVNNLRQAQQVLARLQTEFTEEAGRLRGDS